MFFVFIIIRISRTSNFSGLFFNTIFGFAKVSNGETLTELYISVFRFSGFILGYLFLSVLLKLLIQLPKDFFGGISDVEHLTLTPTAPTMLLSKKPASSVSDMSMTESYGNQKKKKLQVNKKMQSRKLPQIETTKYQTYKYVLKWLAIIFLFYKNAHKFQQRF